MRKIGKSALVDQDGPTVRWKGTSTVYGENMMQISPDPMGSTTLRGEGVACLQENTKMTLTSVLKYTGKHH